MIGSISNPDDKIATDFGSKTNTDNIIVTVIISATDPNLTYALCFLPNPS